MVAIPARIATTHRKHGHCAAQGPARSADQRGADHAGVPRLPPRRPADRQAQRRRLGLGPHVRPTDASVPAYVAVSIGLCALLALAVFLLRKRGTVRPQALLPIVAESAVWAVLMLMSVGWAVQSVMPALQLPAGSVGAAAAQLGPIEKMVMAAGAGFHEEVTFRVILFSGGARLLAALGTRALPAFLLTALLSSLVFAFVHHLGAGGEGLTVAAFSFRTLAGLYLCGLYAARGFAVAVYTHALYRRARVLRALTMGAGPERAVETEQTPAALGRTRRVAAAARLSALLVALTFAGRARADDWLASLPACSSAPARSDLPPRFELVYPRPGLPALVSAGEALITRVRVPSPLTPPPGVQQPRALLGWRAELAGHALPLDAAVTDELAARAQRYVLEVIDVRPDGASTLLYPAAIPIPAWIAPGTYDLALWAPAAAGACSRRCGCSRPARSRAWRGSAPQRPASSRTSARPRSRSMSGCAPRARRRNRRRARIRRRAPMLDPARRGAGAARRVPAVGRRRLRLATEAFDAEVASVMAREQRKRMSRRRRQVPTDGNLGRRAARVACARDLARAAQRAAPPKLASSLRSERGPSSRCRSPRARARRSRSAASRPRPARTTRRARSRVASCRRARSRLRVAAGERAAIHPRRRPAPRPRTHCASSRSRPGARTRAALARGGSPRRGARGALARAARRWPSCASRGGSIPLHTAFGAAQVEHRFLPLGAQRVYALAIAADGRVQRLRGDVRVETARASGCRAAAGSPALPGAPWLWPALLADTKARLAKMAPRSAARNRLPSESGSERAYRDRQDHLH